jgi:hypothetical protein
MKRALLGVVAVSTFAVVVATASKAMAGTQDFTLVNKTGITINNLYVSESAKDDWEEDVLGDDQVEDGDSVNVTFKGHETCKWDLMVKNEAGDGLYWRGIDLCKVSKVTLKCSGDTCTAEFS